MSRQFSATLFLSPPPSLFLSLSLFLTHSLSIRWILENYLTKRIAKVAIDKNLNLSLYINHNFSFSCSFIHVTFVRRCETPPSPPALDPVGIENCKQRFSPLLAFITQELATRSTDIISAVCVTFFWVVNASRNEKSCLQFFNRPRYFTSRKGFGFLELVWK